MSTAVRVSSVRRLQLLINEYWKPLGWMFWLLVTLDVSLRILPWSAIANFETTYPVWVPVSHEKVAAIRSYIYNPPGFLSGGAAAIASTELVVSKEYFQQRAEKYPYIFVSIERGAPKSEGLYFIRYLGKESLDATHQFFYEEKIRSEQFWYSLDEPRWQGNNLILPYNKNWILIFFAGLMIATVAGLVIRSVWEYLDDKLVSWWKQRY